MANRTIRIVSKVVRGVTTTDGAGVNLKRILGSPELNYLDPFLLLDEFYSDNPDDYIAGFPSHPHRGFETVTYLIHGKFRHKDSKGNEGLLTPGSVQWMTAGRGIIHSEMPEMEEGLLWGFQLWVNLPAKLKMVEPNYQAIPSEKIPEVERDGIMVRIISGEFDGQKGPAQTRFPIIFFDVHLSSESKFVYPIPQEMNTFCYVYEGSAEFGAGNEIHRGMTGEMLVLDNGENIFVTATDIGVKFLFLAGTRLEEPVSRGGPFVMNTSGEVRQAFLDYQNGKLDK
ncbi:MAG: pirin family protein [Candidatus Marinimicrobia bacterium]|nr:pirin family protein [Candidatus Neomarinimicrobiota bacterium]